MREGRGGEGGERRVGRRRGRGGEGKNDLTHPLSQIPGYATVAGGRIFPICIYCLKCTKFGQKSLRKII